MEIKADNETLRGYFCWVDLSTHAPHKCLGIKIIRPEQALSPALAPYAQQLDDGPEILAGRRQPVEMAVAAGFRLDMYDPKLLKLLETLSQHCSRYRRCGLEQLSEGPGAEAQLPYDDRAPAVAKDLGSLRDGAELRIHDHSAVILRFAPLCKYVFRTGRLSSCPQIRATGARTRSTTIAPTQHGRVKTCLSKSMTSLRILTLIPRKAASTSMIGSADPGPCCFHTPRTSHRYAAPNSATWHGSSTSLIDAIPRSLGLASTRCRTIADGRTTSQSCKAWRPTIRSSAIPI